MGQFQTPIDGHASKKATSSRRVAMPRLEQDHGHHVQQKFSPDRLKRSGGSQNNHEKSAENAISPRKWNAESIPRFPALMHPRSRYRARQAEDILPMKDLSNRPPLRGQKSMGNVADNSRVHGFDDAKRAAEEKVNRATLPYSPSQTFPGHTDFAQLKVGTPGKKDNYPVDYPVQNVSPTKSKTGGSTREALERKRSHSKFPALIDGSGDSPYPFFDPGTSTKFHAPRRGVVDNFASFDSSPYTVSDIASTQRYSRSGSNTFSNNGQRRASGNDDEKVSKHYCPNPEQVHPGSQPKFGCREKYDTLASPSAEVFDNDSWYASEEASTQLLGNSVHQYPRSLARTRYPSTEKLVTVDKNRLQYTTHCSHREKHISTMRQTRIQADTTQSFSEGSSVRQTLIKPRAHTTDSKAPEGLDKTSKNWYDAPAASPRHRQHRMIAAADRDVRVYANHQELAGFGPHRSVPQNIDILSGNSGTSSPKRQYPVAYDDSAMDKSTKGHTYGEHEAVEHNLPLLSAVSPSTGAPASGGNARFPNDQIRKASLATLPSHEYSAMGGNPFLREPCLSVTPGPGPDVGPSSRAHLYFDLDMRYDNSVQPTPSLPEASSTQFGYAAELLDSPQSFNGASATFYAAGHSAASSSNTVRTTDNSYGSSDTLVGGHGVEALGANPATVASPTRPQMQGIYRGVLNHIERPSGPDTLRLFSTIGIPCEKLCEKMDTLRRVDRTSTGRAKFLLVAGGIPHDIGHIDRLVKDCVQKMGLYDDPFADYIEGAAKGAFKTLSENLKAVGIALRDLGRDDKAATKMTGQFALMKRVTEQLRPDAEELLLLSERCLNKDITNNVQRLPVGLHHSAIQQLVMAEEKWSSLAAGEQK